MEPTPAPEPAFDVPTEPAAQAERPAAQPPANAGGNRDCGDFATQIEAQTTWEAAGGSAANNVWDLDRDRDGVACERNL